MTKSEKRYCRLLAGRQAGDKGFMRLLDCLLSHQTTGDALTTELAQLFPGVTLEPARKYWTCYLLLDKELSMIVLSSKR